MARHRDPSFFASRRTFLKTLGWAPALFLPAPFAGLQLAPSTALANPAGCLPFADLRLTPHFPTASQLDDVLRHVTPGLDGYLSERYAAEIATLLEDWGHALKAFPPALAAPKFLDSAVAVTPFAPQDEILLRSQSGIEVLRPRFAAATNRGDKSFPEQIAAYFASMTRLETAEFQIVALNQTASAPLTVRADIRYEFVGARRDGAREQRIGLWHTSWSREETGAWKAIRWEATEETVSRTRDPIFVDVTSHALGKTDSYRTQMLRGADYWRTVLDAACGIDVYGNNGLAVGDIDNDGFDDLYVCQPSGLPNRLYRNRGDGTFEDITEAAGVGLLEGTACALFADFQNRGLQDLLVVCASGPRLFLNQGNGRFSLKPDAFTFAQPPAGTFTHAAIADYDHDGRLDIYFCLYSYYVGLDQYHYPAPYFDARNGPPNFLFHNQGNATFRDATQAAGLHVDNNRYSFACAWGDSNGDGWPDLYVANDFGRSNLYRNNGDGTFTSIAAEAHVDDAGAGMSACWLDFDNNGKQDLYVANMWSAAGLRVSQQNNFHDKDSAAIRALYHQHARGNSLYRNLGDGRFENVSAPAGVDMGRWAWGSDSWDFDHDGYPDLYVANGYVSGPDARDLSSFFWRQVVGNSPASSTPSTPYEHGWNAINELIRSDVSWSGRERNVLYQNNRDGTFSNISGIAGMDFPDDSRSFALADLDHDGRLEVVLKNRTAPQLRILRNAMKEIGHAIAFRLRGENSNRDAIGAAVTLESGGRRQTKYLQAGSGFLAQHTKEVFFGVGNQAAMVRAFVRWPSGSQQTFDNLPLNHRIEIHEGSTEFHATPFAPPSASYENSGNPLPTAPLPTTVETWLIEPLPAPDFSLPDLAGNLQTLRSLRGSFVLLHFWTTTSPCFSEQVRGFREAQTALTAGGLRVVGVNLDDPSDVPTLQAFASQEKIPFPIWLGSPEVAGIYSILYRYLFDRRRDLPIPCSFLLDASGAIVKLYQGPVDPTHLLNDLRSAPTTPPERISKALPFPGLIPESGFARNDFTYGVALFQHGYLDQAAASFQQVIAAKPQNAEAYYNLGTLYLRRNSLSDARRYLEQALQLRPEYPEAWNNLGMVAAQQEQAHEAVRNFQEALRLRPTFSVALVNLANLYRRQGKLTDAEELLARGLAAAPDDPELNYSLGMAYARQEELQRAVPYLEKAVAARPDYADALNNLGVLYVREQRYQEAEEKLNTCIRVAPAFDQAYLNLARLYVLLKQEDKARQTLQALLRLQPQHKMAQQALEMLQ